MPDVGLLATEPWYRRPRLWRWVVSLAFLGLAIYWFRYEIGIVLQLLGDIALNRPIVHVSAGQREAIAIVLVTLAAGIGFFLLSLWFVGQFVLPVRTADQRWKLFTRLVRFVFKIHGPAIFIKEGVQIAKAEELERSLPGVAMVDLTSAVALEKSWVPLSIGGAPRRGILRAASQGAEEALNLHRSGRSQPMVRVAGPGVVFTEMGEKVRGSASLRRHFRVSGTVTASTRDGFQIQSPVFTLFTLGDAPDNHKVGYYGGTGPEHLKVTKLGDKEKIIEDGDFQEEFDEQDRAEIHQFASRYSSQPFEPVWSPPEPKLSSKPPYVFDEERVFGAIYSRARTAQEDQVEVWSELPLKVAIEIFRDMLSLKTYAELYEPESDNFPFFKEFRPTFARRMRNQGVLTFQLVRRKDGRPFEKGMTWKPNEIETSPIQKLRTSKVLRDRGIKVLVAGFPELTPLHKGVRETLVNHWGAAWQRDALKKESEYVQLAGQERAHIVASAQGEIIDSLMEAYRASGSTRDAVVWQIFQVLDSMVSDPETRPLLPAETLDFLWDLRQYLLPE